MLINILFPTLRFTPPEEPTYREMATPPSLADLQRWGVDQLDEVTRRELMQAGDVPRPQFFDISNVQRPADRVAYMPRAIVTANTIF